LLCVLVALAACSDTPAVSEEPAPDAAGAADAEPFDVQRPDAESTEVEADTPHSPARSSWVRQFGGSALDFGEGVAVGPGGSVYVVGAWGERDAITEAVVRSYSPRGELEWEDRFSAEDGAWAVDVAVDGDSVYVVGKAWGALPGQAPTDDSNAYVRRYETDGALVWTRQFGTAELRDSYPRHVGDTAYAVDVHRGNVYVVGRGESSCCGTRYFNHPWLAKFNGKGEREWVELLEGGWVPNDLEVTDAGVFIAGDTDTLRDVNWSGWDAVVTKRSLHGQPQWSRRFDVNAALGPDIAVSLVVDDGAAYIAAWAPNFNIAPAPTYLLLKLDTAGDVVWTHRSPHMVNALALNDDFLYAAGNSEAPPLTSQNRFSPGEAGIRVTGYATGGASGPVCDFGTVEADNVSAIAASDRRLALAGTTDGTFPDQRFSGERDVFVGSLLMPDPQLADVAVCRSANTTGLPDDNPPTPPREGACANDSLVTRTSLGTRTSELAIITFTPSMMVKQVYFERPVDDGIQIFVRAADAPSAQQLTSGPAAHRLQAAAGERLLVSAYQRLDGEPINTLRVLDASGREVASLPSLRLYQNYTRSGAAHHTFDGERFLVRDGPDLRLWSVQGTNAGGVELSDDHKLSSRAVLTDDGFAYAAAEMTDGPPFVELGAADVFTYDPQGGHRQLTDTADDERHVWASGDTLYWVTDKGVYRKVADESAALVHQGRCGPPHSAVGVVAFGCAADGDGVDAWGEPITSELWMHDGEQAQRVELRGDPSLIHAVRVSTSGIAWFEFDVATALCHGHTSGHVMYYDFASERQIELGEVLAPCTCCETSVPRAQLSLGNRLAAWGWAQRDERTGYSETNGLDFATIDLLDGCQHGAL
jgi:hypothetical protein